MQPSAIKLKEQAVRWAQFWQHQAGEGAKNDGMGNISELLINVVILNKPKVL